MSLTPISLACQALNRSSKFWVSAWLGKGSQSHFLLATVAWNVMWWFEWETSTPYLLTLVSLFLALLKKIMELGEMKLYSKKYGTRGTFENSKSHPMCCSLSLSASYLQMKCDCCALWVTGEHHAPAPWLQHHGRLHVFWTCKPK